MQNWLQIWDIVLKKAHLSNTGLLTVCAVVAGIARKVVFNLEASFCHLLLQQVLFVEEHDHRDISQPPRENKSSDKHHIERNTSAPWYLIKSKLKNQYASHSTMLSPLHTVLSTKKSMKSTSAIDPTIVENTEDSLVKAHTPIIDKWKRNANTYVLHFA